MKRTLVLIIPFSVCCILSKYCSVSDYYNVLFFSLSQFFCLMFCFFENAPRDAVNTCIIHWREVGGTCYVYLKFVSWCNKLWRSVVYFNGISDRFLLFFYFFTVFVTMEKQSRLWLKESSSVESCKMKSFHRKTHSYYCHPHLNLWCGLLLPLVQQTKVHFMGHSQ